MHSQLYGLQVDFVAHGGHFMVLSGTDGLQREDLSDFQLNMLLANKIPQLLDLQVEEMNQHIRLYYNVTGKRMLSHWLRLEKLTIRQFYTLLYRIVDTVASSNVYMLQESRYVLKEDYIYYGDDWNDIYLTYVPKETLLEKNSVSADLQHLASRLVHKVTELSGNGYQEMMSYLMDESFNLAVLKKLLLKHMNHPDGGAHGIGTAAAEAGGVISEGSWRGEAQDHADAVRQQRFQPLQERPGIAAANSADTGKDAAEHLPPAGTWLQERTELSKPAPSSQLYAFGAESPDSVEGGAQAAANPHKRLRLPVFLAGLLAICLIWKLYLDHEGEAYLWICSGLTLLAANAAYTVLWIWKPPSEEDDESEDLDEALGRAGAGWDDSGRQQQAMRVEGVVPFFASRPEPLLPNALEQNGQTVARPESRTDSRSESRPESRLDSKLASAYGASSGRPEADDYYSMLGQRTTLLAPQDATVLLGHAGVLHEERVPVACLEWYRAGTTAVVRINKPSFLIGRAGSEVDLAHEEEGTSRLHAEIVRQDDTYWIKDLGSRNGTRINGEILVPYRMYSLKEGDIVKIITTDYTFKMG